MTGSRFVPFLNNRGGGLWKLSDFRWSMGIIWIYLLLKLTGSTRSLVNSSQDYWKLDTH